MNYLFNHEVWKTCPVCGCEYDARMDSSCPDCRKTFKTYKMPINYKEYHPKWSLISRLIRYRRAHNKCEWCGAINHSIIDKQTGETPVSIKWAQFHEVLHQHHSGWSYSALLKKFGFTKIVLTVAHIDHDKTNNRFNNLAALCQHCHLRHDVYQHIDNRRYGRNWKGKHQLKLEL